MYEPWAPGLPPGRYCLLVNSARLGGACLKVVDHTGAEFGGSSILTLGADGTIHFHRSISEGAGVVTDTEGRIMINRGGF